VEREVRWLSDLINAERLDDEPHTRPPVAPAATAPPPATTPASPTDTADTS